MDILKEIYSKDDLIEFYEDNLTFIEIEDAQIENRLRYRSRFLNMSLKEYTKYLGVRLKHLNKKKHTEEYIRNILEKYKLDNNIVKIPPGTRDYFNINKTVKIKGYQGLKEFITSYGFEYKVIRNVPSIDEKYK